MHILGRSDIELQLEHANTGFRFSFRDCDFGYLKPKNTSQPKFIWMKISSDERNLEDFIARLVVQTYPCNLASPLIKYTNVLRSVRNLMAVQAQNIFLKMELDVATSYMILQYYHYET